MRSIAGCEYDRLESKRNQRWSDSSTTPPQTPMPRPALRILPFVSIHEKTQTSSRFRFEWRYGRQFHRSRLAQQQPCGQNSQWNGDRTVRDIPERQFALQHVLNFAAAEEVPLRISIECDRFAGCEESRQVRKTRLGTLAPPFKTELHHRSFITVPHQPDRARFQRINHPFRSASGKNAFMNVLRPNPPGHQHARRDQRQNTDLPSQRFQVAVHARRSPIGAVARVIGLAGFERSIQLERAVSGITMDQ